MYLKGNTEQDQTSTGTHGSQPVAYHYTIANKARLIVESGELQPTSVGVLPPERPILWLSSSERYDPTAFKARMTETGRRYLTWDEMVSLQPHRFVVPRSALTPWDELKHKSRMEPRFWRALEKAGRQVGANPAQWFGSFDPIPLNRVQFCEIYVDGCWKRARWWDEVVAPSHIA